MQYGKVRCSDGLRSRWDRGSRIYREWSTLEIIDATYGRENHLLLMLVCARIAAQLSIC